MASSTETPESDPFDSLLSLEDQYFTEGYTLGVADGARAGRIEGRLFGLEKGFEKAAEMGRLAGRAAIWRSRLSKSPQPPSDGDGKVEGKGGLALSGSERLRKHVERLAELTEAESLEMKNSEEAVNEFDERLAGARAKAMLVSKIVGEEGGGGQQIVKEDVSAREANEIEITGPSSSSPRRRNEGSGRKTGEMEDFAGLPNVRGAT